jgi:hypothetical protein
MSGSNKNTECSKETSLAITSTISKDLDATLEVLSDFMEDIKGTCQSTAPTILVGACRAHATLPTEAAKTEAQEPSPRCRGSKYHAIRI